MAKAPITPLTSPLVDATTDIDERLDNLETALRSIVERLNSYGDVEGRLTEDGERIGEIESLARTATDEIAGVRTEVDTLQNGTADFGALRDQIAANETELRRLAELLANAPAPVVNTGSGLAGFGNEATDSYPDGLLASIAAQYFRNDFRRYSEEFAAKHKDDEPTAGE